MTSWKLRASRSVAVVVTVVGLSVVVPVGAAHAGPTCGISTGGCSHVKNDMSRTWVAARHDWKCSWGTTGSSSSGCVGGDTYYLNPGEQTPPNQDWDVVQVDPGWCYKIRFVNWWGKDWTETYDQRGKPALYVKVENGSWGMVQAADYTRCP